MLAYLSDREDARVEGEDCLPTCQNTAIMEREDARVEGEDCLPPVEMEDVKVIACLPVKPPTRLPAFPAEPPARPP